MTDLNACQADLYSALYANGLRFFVMDVRSAEMTKYVSNCMLATKISFIVKWPTSANPSMLMLSLYVRGLVAISGSACHSSTQASVMVAAASPKDVRALIRLLKRRVFSPRTCARRYESTNRDPEIAHVQ